MNRYAVPNATMGFPGRPRNGGSRPRFYRFDDDVTRLVKWQPSQHGDKACYNELAASRLAQLIGAPLLRGGVVYVGDQIIPSDHRQDGAFAGLHFGVTRMEGENFIPAQHYTEVENISQLPFAAVHLAWLRVEDQQGHNQYLHRRETQTVGKRSSRFMLIDMRFMFGSPGWKGATLGLHDSYQLPQHMAEKLTYDKLQPALTALAAVRDEAIRECLMDCPDSWNISLEDRSKAVEIALTARARIESIIRNGNPGLT